LLDDISQIADDLLAIVEGTCGVERDETGDDIRGLEDAL
jgi:hypothetical protein